jgi:hypothetical protein
MTSDQNFKLQYELVAKLCPLMVRTIMAPTIDNQPPTLQEAVMSSENIHLKELCEAGIKPLKENHVPDDSETNIMVRGTSDKDSPSLHSTPSCFMGMSLTQRTLHHLCHPQPPLSLMWQWTWWFLSFGTCPIPQTLPQHWKRPRISDAVLPPLKCKDCKSPLQRDGGAHRLS